MSNGNQKDHPPAYHETFSTAVGPYPALPEKPLPSPFESSHTPASASSSSYPGFCCISLHEGDKLRILNFPAALVDPFRYVLQTAWHRGIQSEKDYGGSYQFKMKGYPWYGAGEDSVGARRLVSGIMQYMYRSGWELYVRTDVSRKHWDKDTFIFRHTARTDPAALFCSMAFNRTDRIRLIDAPEDMVSAVRACLAQSWTKGVSTEQIYHGAHEFKLNGTPWYASGKDTVSTRALVMRLLETLDRMNWDVYASVDVMSTGNNDGELGDVDSFILKRR
ncbi:hypothetical protein HDU85_003658 [Gaertneriomyces sp. JEL0708]|nr:hypothetical protein HDU85_003658 [Gaertneriomyces sp. JEL0708]